VSDNENSQSRWLKEKKPGMAPREVVMGLDKLERGVSFGAAAIALIFTALSLPGILKATTVRHETAKPATAAPFCQLPYKYLKGIKSCVHEVISHPSYWLPGFLTFLIIGLFIFFFAYRRKRAGVIVSCLILGFTMNPTSSVGLPFMFAGGWLLIRAQRLNKYGDASFSGSSRKAKEISKARKEGRSAPTANAPTLKPTPEASKRYTPKQRKRRR
jgi:hypothetical protein